MNRRGSARTPSYAWVVTLMTLRQPGSPHSHTISNVPTEPGRSSAICSLTTRNNASLRPMRRWVVSFIVKILVLRRLDFELSVSYRGRSDTSPDRLDVL